MVLRRWKRGVLAWPAYKLVKQGMRRLAILKTMKKARLMRRVAGTTYPRDSSGGATTVTVRRSCRLQRVVGSSDSVEQKAQRLRRARDGVATAAGPMMTALTGLRPRRRRSPIVYDSQGWPTNRWPRCAVEVLTKVRELCSA